MLVELEQHSIDTQCAF